MICLRKMSVELHNLHALSVDYYDSQKNMLDMQSHLDRTIKTLQEEIIKDAVKQDFLSLVKQMTQSMDDES